MSENFLHNYNFENQPESRSFIRTALAWHGSVTPRVLLRVGVVVVYASVIVGLEMLFGNLSFPITPFEFSGAVLGLLLVQRVNAGMDRWWEARKLWGNIVNQSRNLAQVGLAYCNVRGETMREYLRYVAAWPHVIRASLRDERHIPEIVPLLGAAKSNHVMEAQHMPSFVGLKIAGLIRDLRFGGMDSYTFLRAETERSSIVDAVGACERIKNTRMPFVLAVNTRRFILLFLALLPFALIDRLGFFTPLVVALASYPLFSLDEIGVELQNPFSLRNLSHLPLNSICKTIEANIIGLDIAAFDGVTKVEENSLPTPSWLVPDEHEPTNVAAFNA